MVAGAAIAVVTGAPHEGGAFGALAGLTAILAASLLGIALGRWGLTRPGEHRSGEDGDPAGTPRDPLLEPGVPGMLLLGERAVATGHVEEGLLWFQAASRLEPGATAAHVCQGLCLLGLARPDEAAYAFRLASRLDPGDLGVKLSLARSEGLAGDGRAALAALAPVLAATPEIADDVFEDPVFEALRDHPRFLQLTGRL